MIIYVGTFIDSKPARHRFKKKQNMVALTGYYYVLLWLQSVNKLWTTHFILPKMSKDHWSRGRPGGGPAETGMRFCLGGLVISSRKVTVISPEFDLYKLDHCGDLPHLETLEALNRMIWPVAQLVIQHLSGVSPTKSEEGKANHRWRSPKRHGFVRKWGMRYSCNTATLPCCIENMINHSSRFEGTLFLDKPGLLLHWSPDNLEPRIALTISSGIVRLWIDSVFTQHGEKLKEWRTVASFIAIWWFDVCGAYFMLGQWQDMSSWPSWPRLAASCPFLAASHEDEYAREKKGDGGHRAKGCKGQSMRFCHVLLSKSRGQ